MRTFTFDVRLFASITVPANSEEEALELLREHVHTGSANFGAWPDGDPILSDVSLDDDADLIEIDGEAV